MKYTVLPLRASSSSLFFLSRLLGTFHWFSFLFVSGTSGVLVLCKDIISGPPPLMGSSFVPHMCVVMRALLGLQRLHNDTSDTAQASFSAGQLLLLVW